MRIEGVETTRWEASDSQTIRLQTSDVRLAVWLAAYTPLTAGGMAAGDFSTLLEMTEGKRFEV